MDQKRIERGQVEADLVLIRVVHGLSCNYTKSTDNHCKCEESNPFHHKSSNLSIFRLSMYAIKKHLYQSSSKNGVLG